MKTCVGRWVASVLAALIFATPSFAQAPAPPSDLTAVDHPWDNGTRIDLSWTPSPTTHRYRATSFARATDTPEFSRVDMVPKGTTRFTVFYLDPGKAYLFQVVAVSPNNSESTPAATDTPVQPRIEWFDGTRFWFLIVPACVLRRRHCLHLDRPAWRPYEGSSHPRAQGG